MKTRQFWLMIWLLPAILRIATPVALAQPKPITACGTIISAPGSYRVTQNLGAISTSTTCISVTVAAVTIDLGGFVLTGPSGSRSPAISATSGPLTVSNGSTNLFDVGISAPNAVTLSNVEVTNSPSTGAVLGDNAQVTDSNFVRNGTAGSGDGLDVGRNARLTRCGFFSNKGNGVLANGAGAVIAGSRAAGNTLDGFLTHGGRSVLRSNTATGNTSVGFQDQGGGSTFTTNVASGNGNAGFLAFSSAFIGNNASGNKNVGFSDQGENTFDGNTAFNNTLDGFLTGSPFSTFVNNTASVNGRYGFNLLCPDNLINDTAEGNKTQNLNLVGACQLISVLH